MAEEGAKTSAETDTGATPVELPVQKGRRAFHNVRRELHEEELAASGARRLLLDSLDAAERELEDLRKVRDDFHKVDKEAAVLREKRKVDVAAEIAYGICLSSGFGLIGVVTNIWDKPLYGGIVLAISIVLIVGGIVVKVGRR